MYNKNNNGPRQLPWITPLPQLIVQGKKFTASGFNSTYKLLFHHAVRCSIYLDAYKYRPLLTWRNITSGGSIHVRTDRTLIAVAYRLLQLYSVSWQKYNVKTFSNSSNIRPKFYAKPVEHMFFSILAACLKMQKKESLIKWQNPCNDRNINFCNGIYHITFDAIPCRVCYMNRRYVW